jgi:hypothetical protein
MHLLKNFGSGGASITSKPGQSAGGVKSNYFSSLKLAYEII